MEQEIQSKSEVFKTLLLTSFISFWLYWLWSRRDLYRFAMRFPGSFGAPLIGSIARIKHFKYIIQGIEDLIEKFKVHTFCVWCGFYPMIMSADPEFIEKVLCSSELLNKAEAVYMPLYKAFGGGIIASKESEWHHNRKMINPSFHHKVLLSFIPVFNKGKHLAISSMNSMVDNSEHKLVDMLERISLGISVETTMGKQMKHGDQVSEDITTKYRFMMEKLVHRVMLSCVNMEAIFGIYIKHTLVKNRLDDFVLKLVNRRIANLNEETTPSSEGTEDSVLITMKKTPNIFIDQAIRIYQKGKFSFNDIIAESNTIVAASFETTANGVFSTLLMLAMHPEIQERLFAEIVNVFPNKDFEMEFEHMQHLPYLDMVVNETLRLAPSVPIIGRQVVKDTQLSKDLLLPKNLQIIISIFSLHRRTDIWGPNAKKFDPDNFLPENISSKHPYSYIPFSKGVRNCIGWRYALFAIKIMLTGILRNYRLTTSMKYEEIQFIENIALKYANEPLFKIYRRD